MNELVPAILAHDEKEFREKFGLMDGLAPLVQLDVMDGKFVPNSSWCDFSVLKSLKGKTALELHLMVEDPEVWIEKALAVPSVKRLVWHVEGMGDHRELLRDVRALEREAGLALSPGTPADTLTPYLGRMDEILVLGVEPGFSGQKLLPKTLDKVREIKGLWPDIPLAFDGGVSRETIGLLRQAGVTRFCAASSIFSAANPAAALAGLQALII